VAVSIEKTICAALHEAHKRQVEEVMDTLSEEPEVLQVSGFLPPQPLSLARRKGSRRSQPKRYTIRYAQDRFSRVQGPAGREGEAPRTASSPASCPPCGSRAVILLRS
jgi:hypothetical protein